MTDLGQIYTKSNIAHYMVSLFDLSKQMPILEPCYGKGAFLDALLADGYTNVTGCEIDTSLFIDTQNKYSQYKLFNQDFLLHESLEKFDGIIMNPPYIRQEKIDELEIYGISKKKLRTVPVFSELPSNSNIYMYFILKAINLLKNGGQLIVIFPSSWMKTKSGAEFQKIMLSQCVIEKQVHIYGEIFEQKALVEVIILKLTKIEKKFFHDEEYIKSKNGKLSIVQVNKKHFDSFFSCHFSELATIRRGITTGCNEMYINPILVSTDNQCVKPIISSPKSIEGYTTQNARLDQLFLPIEPIISDDIKSYLQSWKERIIQEKKPKTLYTKICNNNKWYELQEVDGEGILFSYFVRNDMKFVMNETKFLVRDNFYIIKPKINKWIFFALLNNYYTYYQLELFGKRYGAGLLKLQRYDLEELSFPEYEKFSDEDKNKLVKLSHELTINTNNSIIDALTILISKYSKIKHEDIMKKYTSIKANRLEV